MITRHISTITVGFVLCMLSLHVQAQIQQPFLPISDTISLSLDIHTVTMTSLDIEALLAEDSIDAQYQNNPPRFGYEQTVDLGVSNAGTWDTLGSGDLVWRLRVISSGAYSINLNFNSFLLPQGGRLYVYNEQRTMTIGAFTEINNRLDSAFATGPVKGDTIIIEYNQPASTQDLPLLNISGVVHAYRNIFSLDAGFGKSLPCHRNVHCPEFSEWEIQGRSVVLMCVDRNTRWCSGSMINNVNFDGKPYLLTANHCLSGHDPNLIRIIFNYESDDCDNPSSEPDFSQSILGATIKSYCATLDFALLELSSAPHAPPNSYQQIYYAGWSRDDIPPLYAAVAHHPRGDIKKMLLSSHIEYPNEPVFHVWANETPGLLEPGSSGSPVFNQDGRIIGTNNTGSYPSCDVTGNFGAVKFSSAMECVDNGLPAMKTWLAPNSSALRIDGLHPYPNASIDITVDQSRANNDRLVNTTVGRWDFVNSSFVDLNITNLPAFFTSSIGSLEVLKGLQGRVTSPDEKYHDWKSGIQSLTNNLQNQRSFKIGRDPLTLTSQFNQIKENITITTDLFEVGGMGGEVRFHDPWYIDFEDPLYNGSWRNRGMQQAYPRSRSVGSTGFRPDFTTTFQESPKPYQGVFLNQGGVNFSDPPYYSLSAPEVQTINGVDYATIGWYNQDQKAALQYPNRLETGIVFTDDGAVVAARLKGHLLSTTSYPPTKNNNQRKIAIQLMDDGTTKHLHSVYESGGRIFYTKSTNNGTSWTGEMLVNNDFNITTSKNPSIAYERNNVFIIYVEGNDIVTKSKDYRQDNWLEIDRQTLSVPMESSPVIAASPIQVRGITGRVPVCVSIWEDGDKKLKYSVVSPDGIPALVEEVSGTWIPALGRVLRDGRSVGQTQLQPLYPSIAGQRDGVQDPAFAAVWNEWGELFYSDIILSGAVTNTIQVHRVQDERVTAGGFPIRSDQAPSITFVQDSYPVIVYASDYGTSKSNPVFLRTSLRLLAGLVQLNPVSFPPWPYCINPTNAIVIRMRSKTINNPAPSGWNATTYMSRSQCNEVWDPSISVTRDPNPYMYDGVRVVANDGIGTYSVGRVALSWWFHVTPRSDGYDPTLPVRGFYDPQNAANLRVVFSNHASSPFVHGIHSDDRYLNKATAFTTNHVRMLMASGDNDTTFALYGIHAPVVRDSEQNESPVEWLMTVDTTTIKGEISIEERMRSDAFTVPVSGSMKYGVMLYARNTNQFEQPFSFAVKFVNASNGSVVLLDSIPASALPDSNVYGEYTIDLSSIAGQEVYLTASLTSGADSVFTEVIDLFINDGDAEKVRDHDRDVTLPASITLEANHPNPFSVRTELTYTLSQPGDMRLSVYDVHGRIVKELTRGHRNAGRHTQTFLAGELPSGVYIYRLEALGRALSRRMSVIK